MKKNNNQPIINDVITNKVQDLEDQVLLLEKELEMISDSIRISKHYSKLAEPRSKIINFPVPKQEYSLSQYPRMESFSNPVPYQAKPGNALPAQIPDFRPGLQRDGLILLAWDWRMTESGGFYTAYWVTSSGIPRFYASKLHSFDTFISARPDHKSYAAEDGIEFYGQDAPAYMVHVAPELMMSNPRHGELRKEHILTLKRLGSELDFNYKYLLKNEKKQQMPSKNRQAG